MQRTDGDWRSEVEGVLEGAFEQGREKLYEHEVYRILAAWGIRTPLWEFLTSPREITQELLTRFEGTRVVLKVVSPGVAHKEKLGGVKILGKEPEELRNSFREMQRTFADMGFPVDGILMTTFVEYSLELGNEMLLGFRESQAFGPVLSCGKGGSDAEHFAAQFPSSAILLAPINQEEARRVLSSSNFMDKFFQRQREGCSEKFIEAGVKLGRLAAAYSHFFESSSQFVFREFEVNPFVFDSDCELLALDGYANFTKKKTAPRTIPPGNPDGLSPFFKPDGIAVVGVSGGDHTKVGNVIIDNLTRLGRKDLFCLNPKGGKVEEGVSYPLYTSLEELPRAPELVVVTVPAKLALGVVREAAEVGVRGILLIPGGFSESSQNQEVEEEIRRIAEETGIRILGPNCLGVIFAGDGENPGMNTFFIPENKFRLNLTRKKGLAIFTQSGALGLVQLSRLEKALSPQVVVSYGNQLDIDPSDLVDYFRRDPAIRVMGLYIEGFKEAAGRRFFNLTKQIDTPLVVYKAGRTEEGCLATQSHTAALAGEYAVAEAAMKQAGLVAADTIEDYHGLLKIFTLLDGKRVTGRRFALVANAGYEKANAADNLGNLTIADLNGETISSLRKNLPSFVSVSPLLDVTPMVSDGEYIACINALLKAPEVDALCVSIVPHAGLIHTTNEEIDGFEGNIARGIVEASARNNKPLVVSLPANSGGGIAYNRLGEVLEGGGVPVYSGVEQAMASLDRFVKYWLAKASPEGIRGDS